MKWLLRQNEKNFPSDNYSSQAKLNEAKARKYSKHSTLMRNEVKLSLQYVFLMYLFAILIVPYPSLKKEECLKSYSGTIDLKIAGTGYQYILGDIYHGYFPDLVYLNGWQLTSYNKNNRYIYIDPSSVSQSTNRITLKWNDGYTIKNLHGIFSVDTNIIEVDMTNFDISSVTDLGDFLYGCSSVKYIKFPTIRTTSLKDMVSMFYNCSSLVEIDLSYFDTSHVTNMSFAFYGCENLKTLDISSFVTTEVIDMQCMFYRLHSIENIQLRHFDTSKVKDMSYMFYECKAISSLDLSSFKTSSVVDMSVMFYECDNLKSLDLRNFDTSQVTNMEHMFRGCNSMTSLDITSFDTSKVEEMNYLFFECNSLTSLDLKSFDTTNVRGMEAMFGECLSLTSLDLSKFKTENVEIMAYMFNNCQNLESLDISSFKTEKVQYMDLMFGECYALPFLDLSKFYTPELISMKRMFYGCMSLTSLDVSNFYTENVESMTYLFYYCESLTSLDISNFKTDNTKSMDSMFGYCSNLISLDLTNFKTSKVTNMKKMFYKCQNLEKLKINSFDTSSVQNMEKMFCDCGSLTSLDLTSFTTSRVTKMESMFSGCEKIYVIDLSTFSTSSLSDIQNLFLNCINLNYINFRQYNEQVASLVVNDGLDFIPENIVVCINLNNNVDKLLELIYEKQCPVIDCSGDWKSKQKKINAETGTCVEDCSNFKYENDNKCYSTCPEGADFCHPETTNIITTTNIATTNKIEETTNKIEETTHNINPVKSTISNIIESTSGPISTSNNNINNPEETSLTNANRDIDSVLTTLIKEIIINTSEKPKIDSSLIYKTYLSKESLSAELDDNLWENNEEIHDGIISDKMPDYNASEGEEISIEGKDNYHFQITTSENEKAYLDENNNTNQFSKIDLGECENLLKRHYHINESAPLIIFKFEKITNVSTERSLQYEVYEPFDKVKLNLSICENTTIDVYVPVELSEELQKLYNELKDLGYDLFDENSDFYKDICTPFKSPNGTDVPLADRYNSYFNNNETLCQSNCKFSDYSMETKYLKCECDINNSEINIKEIKKFKPTTLYLSYYDTLKYSNYKVLKCYKLAFSIKSVTKNKGSIIVIFLFGIYLIFLIIYCKEGIEKLKLILAKEVLNYPVIPDNELFNSNDIVINEKSVKKIIVSKPKNDNKKNDNLIITSQTSLKPQNKKMKTKSNFKNPPKKSTTTPKKKIVKKVSRNNQINPSSLSNKNSLYTNKTNSLYKFTEINNKNKNSNKQKEKCNSDKNDTSSNEKLDNFELNNLEYDMALRLDQRNLFQVYLSILKREHLLIFTFFIRNDYNIVYIKFSRFVFLISTNMALNVFFFSDETMHKMNLDYGKYNFIQQIPQIVYSTLVSQLIEVLLCFLSLTDKHYYQVKNLDEFTRNKIFPILKCIKKKIAFFYIFTCIMYVFNWYTVACFCAVYERTQIAFIKDSFYSFALGLLYPFVLYLFPAILRIISLRASKFRCKCIYAISDIIPIF